MVVIRELTNCPEVILSLKMVLRLS